MKNSLSYVLPIGALLILTVLAFRWMSNRSEPVGEISSNAEGIEISDLLDTEASPLGVADSESIELEPANESVAGTVRYSTDETTGRTQFSLFSDLPELQPEDGFYQLWFEGEKGTKKAMRLEFKKGGYMGEGVLSSEFDQVKVVVSKETTDDDTMEEVLLEGNLSVVVPSESPEITE